MIKRTREIKSELLNKKLEKGVYDKLVDNYFNKFKTKEILLLFYRKTWSI